MGGMVHVDPDHFKGCMAEFDGYVSNAQEAGSMCHKESCLMQEIAQEVALQSGQNVWIDGSLRDGVWFGKVFDSIRARFATYRIAIVYVTADEDKVRERCRERALRTGRDIPESLIAESLKSPKESLALLTPKSDFCARITNNTGTPVLDSVEMVDHSGCWDMVRERFARTEPELNEFPNFLAPISIRRAMSLCGSVRMCTDDDGDEDDGDDDDTNVGKRALAGKTSSRSREASRASSEEDTSGRGASISSFRCTRGG